MSVYQARVERTEVVRARLVAVMEACRACELASTVAADTLIRRRVSPVGLIACAAVCRDSAQKLAGLVVPDAARVRDELIACRAACASARETCEAMDEEDVAWRCLVALLRCEDACTAAVASA